MTHIDLFSGIGGFSLAADRVWGRKNIEHIFIDNDKFCQQVLKKHWPEAEIYGDIRTFTNTESSRQNGGVKFGISELGEVRIAPANSEGGQSGKQTEQEGWQDIGGGDSAIGNTKRNTSKEVVGVSEGQNSKPRR